MAIVIMRGGSGKVISRDEIRKELPSIISGEAQIYSTGAQLQLRVELRPLTPEEDAMHQAELLKQPADTKNASVPRGPNSADYGSVVPACLKQLRKPARVADIVPDVVAQTRCSPQSVYSAVSRMAQNAQIRRVKRGVYVREKN